MKKRRIYIIMIIVAVVAGIFVGTKMHREQLEVETRSMILKKMSNVNELNVSQYEYQGKITDKKGNNSFGILGAKIPIIGTWRKVTLLFNSTVKAAVNLKNCKVTKVDLSNDTVNVLLNAPYISSVEISNIDVYEETGIFKGKNNYEDVAQIYNEKMKSAAQYAALKANIIKKAKENAQKDIEGIIKKINSDIKTVHIKYK